MGTSIVEFGDVPSGILAAFAGNGYGVKACGTSIPKLQEAVQHPDDLDAIVLAENGVSEAVTILAPVRSIGGVPLILLHDQNRTCDPSQFDLIVPEDAPLPKLLAKVAACIERSRVVRAETKKSGERLHMLLRQAASLREQSVTATIDSQHIRRAKLKGPETERIRIPCILVVDDYARWRDTMCSMLKDCVDCPLLCEAGNGIEAVLQAAELKPQLILLDLDLPDLNGIEVARKITQSTPDSVILFVSMNSSKDVVSEALSTGARGYLLKVDAGNELRPAIEAVLHNKQYLSGSLRGRNSATSI